MDRARHPVASLWMRLRARPQACGDTLAPGAIVRRRCDSHRRTRRTARGRLRDRRYSATTSTVSVAVDVGVELDRHLDRAELLERLGERRSCAGRARPGLGLHRGDDVGRRDRAEELAALAGARRDLDARLPASRVGELLRRRPVAVPRGPGGCGASPRPGCTTPFGRLRSRARAGRGSCARSRRRPRRGRPCGRGSRRPRGARPSCRRLLGVRAVALGVGVATAVGASTPSSRPSRRAAVGRRRPRAARRSRRRRRAAARPVLAHRRRGRARSPRSPPPALAALRHLAHAVRQQRHLARDADRPARPSRCCCASLPVTRRARILARSDMNRRSRLTSL